MAEIVLTNVSRSITLVHVTNYEIPQREDYAVKIIPGKSTATIDTDTIGLHPRIATIEAKVTSAELTVLETMRSDRLNITLTDGVHTITVRMNELIPIANMGSADTPWIVRLRLISTT